MLKNLLLYFVINIVLWGRDKLDIKNDHVFQYMLKGNWLLFDQMFNANFVEMMDL